MANNGIKWFHIIAFWYIVVAFTCKVIDEVAGCRKSLFGVSHVDIKSTSQHVSDLFFRGLRPRVMPNTHRQHRRDSTVESRRRCEENSQLAHNCRQIRSSTVWKLTKQTPINSGLREFWSILIMSSLVTNFNSSTAQEILNWVTTADWCVHTTDAPQLCSWVASAWTLLPCWA